MSYSKTLEKIFDNQGQGPNLKPTIIPMATAIDSNGNEAATTAWIREFVVTPIYVDHNKPAGGDGLSPDTAAQTINDGIEIAKAMHFYAFKIIVATGTYTETITLDNVNCTFDLLGNVTLSGGIYIRLSSNIHIYSSTSSTAKLTINTPSNINGINCSVRSVLKVYVPLEITVNGADAIRNEDGSYILFTKPVILSGLNNAKKPIDCIIGSLIKFGSTLNVNSSFSGALTAWNDSFIHFAGRLYEDDGSMTGNAAGLVVLNNSFIYLGPASPDRHRILCGTTANKCILVDGHSYLYVEGGVDILYTGVSNGNILQVVGNSSFDYSNTNDLLYLKSTTSNILSAVNSGGFSRIGITPGGNVSIDCAGVFQRGHFNCVGNSYIGLSSSIQEIWGSQGPKARCVENSVIILGGNTLPGTSDGTINNGGYVGS